MSLNYLRKIGLIGLLIWGARGVAAPQPATGYFKKVSETTYVLSLRPGAKLVASLRAFQKATGVKTASVTGLGVLKNTRLGQYRFLGEPLVEGGTATSPQFPGHDDVVVPGHREVVSLVCNLTTRVLVIGGETPSDPHCHVALAGSDDPSADSRGGYPVVGGHLVEAEVGVIAELFVTTYPTELDKMPGGELGGTVLDLDESQGGTSLRY